MERRAIVIVGPTGSGKTKLSILLATRLNTDILSADSRQFYKYLDIGTAKVTKEEQNLVKHHFIDNLLPDDIYNVSKYEKEAEVIIHSLQRQNKIPIITGGSGLYIKTLIDGIIDDVETDDDYRNELLELRKKEGNESLYNLLTQVDKTAADTMLPQNWKRVIRALEVKKLSGKSITEMQYEQQKKSDIQYYQFGLDWSRELLYERINNRVDWMLENGLVDEVNSLLKKGFSPDLNSLNTVGYKEIIEFTNNIISLDRAVELIKRNSRRYAKRQMTWFRKDKRISWIKIESESDLAEACNFIYDKFSNIH